MEAFEEWIISLNLRPYHEDVMVYVPRENDSLALELRKILDFTNAGSSVAAINNTMDREIAILRNLNYVALARISV